LLRLVLGRDPLVLEVDIRHRTITQVGGNQGEFLAGFQQHGVQRRATGDQATAGRSPSTGGQDRSIAVQHSNISWRHTQHVGHHLGKGRL
jgi:hypothetical protein